MLGVRFETGNKGKLWRYNPNGRNVDLGEHDEYYRYNYLSSESTLLTDNWGGAKTNVIVIPAKCKRTETRDGGGERNFGIVCNRNVVDDKHKRDASRHV